jgi:hypothetical protein
MGLFGMWREDELVEGQTLRFGPRRRADLAKSCQRTIKLVELRADLSRGMA